MINVLDQLFGFANNLNGVVLKNDCLLIARCDKQDDSSSDKIHRSIVLTCQMDLLVGQSKFLASLFRNPTQQKVPLDVDSNWPRFIITLPGSSSKILNTFHRLINLMIAFSRYSSTCLWTHSLPDYSQTIIEDEDQDLIHLCFFLGVTEPLLTLVLHCFFHNLIFSNRDLIADYRRGLVRQALDFALCSPQHPLLRCIYDNHVMSEFPEYPLDHDHKTPLSLPFIDPPRFLGTWEQVPILEISRSSTHQPSGVMELHLLGDRHSGVIDLSFTKFFVSLGTITSNSLGFVSLIFLFWHDERESLTLELTPSIKIFALPKSNTHQSFLEGPIGFGPLYLNSFHGARSESTMKFDFPIDWFPIRMQLILHWKIVRGGHVPTPAN